MEIKILTKEELKHYLSSWCELYRKCFSDPIEESIVAQRYIDNPYGDLLMCVAFDEDKIVANYSVCPCEVYVNGNKYKAAISLNTMTDPDYAGQGLLGKLASTLYSYMQEIGYSLVYGFPNYLSNKTFTSRLGWKDVYEFPTLEYVFKPCDTQNTEFKQCRFEEITDKPVTNKIEICKDRTYLNWRFDKTPDRQYLYANNGSGEWVIYKFFRDQINIIDTNLTSTDSLFDMFRYFQNISNEQNMKSITVWSKINSQSHYCYEKIGFINRYPIRYFAVLAFENFDIDVFDHRNWLISMGDDNVY